MSPAKNNKISHTVSPPPGLPLLLSCLSLAVVTLFLTSCSVLLGGMPMPANRETSMGGGILKGLRPIADPALVQRIRENELNEAAKQAAQSSIISQTGGPQIMQPGLGRNLPKVYTNPISAVIDATTQSAANSTMLASANQANAFANQNTQLATYESAYSTVPPPPPGSLAAGLVPPPPAVTLSTQAQTYGGNAADFYNNPYFNPYGVPAPPQALAPERRPAGLFGDGNARSQPQQDFEKASSKHKADFVPITPTGMEARSPYKQRDDIRALWRAALKDSNNAGAIADNKRLLDELAKLDIGLPTDSSRGNFNISSRQVETIFKSSAIDRRAFPEVRKLQTELVQAYYRYLSTYNKYALAEQTAAARQQQVDVSESDSERQRAAADLAQAKNDLDSIKDDMRSAEFELAAASSPAAARTVISRVAGVAPSIEVLAQGCSQNNHVATNRGNRFTNVFESVFRHSHNNTGDAVDDETTTANDTGKSKAQKTAQNKSDDDEGWMSKMFSSEHNKTSKLAARKKDSDTTGDIAQEKTTSSNDDSDLSPAPKKNKSAAIEDLASDSQETVSKPVAASNNAVSFELKGVNIKPRKSVLTVAVKNSGGEAYELNPDAISISEGNHRLAAADMRADFDMTSIQPDHEVKGTITVFGRPWNDHLLVYLNDGNKKIQLKR